MPVLTRGAEAAEASAGSFRGGRLIQQRFDEGERIFLRLVSAQAEWLTALSHNYIPTKPVPASVVAEAKEKKRDVKWPKAMWCICQNDKIFAIRDADGEPIPGQFEPGYGSCPIHTIYKGQTSQFGQDLTKPASVTYALCVVRKAVVEGGKVKGFVDVTEEYEDKDGNKTTVPAVRYLAQKWSNFWSPINNGAFITGDVCDRDWMVRRTGKDYDVQPCPPVEGLAPGQAAWAVYTDTLEKIGADLGAMILSHASAEHYNRFFVPGEGEEAAPPEGSAASAPSGEAAPAGDEPDQGAIDSFAADLKSRVEAGATASA